jgi:hypothetical protein
MPCDYTELHTSTGMAKNFDVQSVQILHNNWSGFQLEQVTNWTGGLSLKVLASQDDDASLSTAPRSTKAKICVRGPRELPTAQSTIGGGGWTIVDTYFITIECTNNTNNTNNNDRRHPAQRTIFKHKRENRRPLSTAQKQSKEQKDQQSTGGSVVAKTAIVDKPH